MGVMPHDVRTMYEKWWQKGYQYEVSGKFKLAASAYQDCKELAEMYEEHSAVKDAQKRIDACQLRNKESGKDIA